MLRVDKQSGCKLSLHLVEPWMISRQSNEFNRQKIISFETWGPNQVPTPDSLKLSSHPEWLQDDSLIVNWGRQRSCSRYWCCIMFGANKQSGCKLNPHRSEVGTISMSSLPSTLRSRAQSISEIQDFLQSIKVSFDP
jgi:hypothetical protein